MPGRKPPEAVRAYIEPLQRAVSCISKTAVLGVSGGYYISEKPHSLFLMPPGPMRLRPTDSEDMRFDVVQQYAIVPRADGDYKVRTLYYSYKIDDFDSGKEILAYHWHPDEKVKYPHLHVSDGAEIGRKELIEAHFPTGRVALEDVIQFLIEFFHVPPARENWEELLERGRQEFRRHSTWARFDATPSGV